MRRFNHSSRFFSQFADLPFGHKWKDVLTIINGKAYGEEYKVSGTYPICGSGGIMGYGEKKMCDRDSIILGRKGNIDKPIYMSEDYWIVDTAFCLNPNTELIHPVYLYYWCKQFDFQKLNKQAVLPSLTRSDLEQIDIQVPEMAEQLVFVGIVNQADKSKFSDFKSRFIEQFGTPHNAEWPLLSFAEFASIDAQMTDDFEAYADSPHIGIDSIEQNTGKILNYRTVSEDSLKSGKYIFTRNHIIYSKIRPNLNKVAEPDFDGLCSADAYPLLAKEKVCKKRFLAIILRSDDFLSYIVPLSNRTGMPKANREQLEGYSFRMPPVDIQDAFLSIVEQADKSKYLN